MYGFNYTRVSKVCKLLVAEQPVLAGVIRQRKGQIVRIGLAHNRIRPIVKLLTHVLRSGLWGVHKREELCHNLGGCVNPMVRKLLNRRRPHARNLVHLEIKQRTVHKLHNGIGAQRTLGRLVIEIRRHVWWLTGKMSNI